MIQEASKSLQSPLSDGLLGAPRPGAARRLVAAAALVVVLGLALSITGPDPARAADTAGPASTKSPADAKAAASAWTPPACKPAAAAVEAPTDTSPAGWEAALAASLARVKSLGEGVDNMTEFYTSALDRPDTRPADRAKLGQALDAARGQYAEARCGFVALEAAAREAGVTPGVLKKYQLPSAGGAGDAS